MSSESHQSAHEARILDLTEQSDGSLHFTIDASTTSGDLLATLEYLNPDEEMVAKSLRALLKAAIGRKKGNALADRHFVAKEPFESSSRQAKIEPTTIIFGENPSYDDAREVFTELYGGEEADAEICALTLTLVDIGALEGMVVKTNNHNEFSETSESAIQAEMAQLTRSHYFGDTPPTE